MSGDEWPDPDSADVEAALNLASTLDHIEDPSNRERALRNLARAVLRLRARIVALTAEHSGACDDMAVCGNCWTSGRIDAAARAEAQVAAVRALHHVTVIQTTGGPREMCDHCDTGDPFCTVSNDWPCPTIAVLDAPPDVTR